MSLGSPAAVNAGVHDDVVNPRVRRLSGRSGSGSVPADKDYGDEQTIMLQVVFTANDLANIRLASSPLWEVIASVHVLKSPDGHPFHRPWIDRVRQRLRDADLDWQLLSALVPVPATTIPDFVSPPPSVPSPDLELELARLMATPADQVHEALGSLPEPTSPAVGALYRDPVGGLACLANVIRGYWDVALAPYWPRMLAMLESDVLYRARMLADGGVHKLLSDLDPKIQWCDVSHTLHVHTQHFTGSVKLDGRGLLLVPSLFIWPKVYAKLSRPWQPTLRYPPRGIAELWQPSRTSPSVALSAVIGRSRTRLLSELRQPTTTSELAVRTGLTSGGVSQHLKVLRDAGLVSAHRAGRYVLYVRTELAQSLFASASDA
jgi:DNA-binding transcriptional ArsR family regulator